jgi:hypothetical protein
MINIFIYNISANLIRSIYNKHHITATELHLTPHSIMPGPTTSSNWYLIFCKINLGQTTGIYKNNLDFIMKLEQNVCTDIQNGQTGRNVTVEGHTLPNFTFLVIKHWCLK